MLSCYHKINYLIVSLILSKNYKNNKGRSLNKKNGFKLVLKTGILKLKIIVFIKLLQKLWSYPILHILLKNDQYPLNFNYFRISQTFKIGEDWMNFKKLFAVITPWVHLCLFLYKKNQ